MSKIHVANPSDRVFTRHSFILWVEPVGPTLVLVYADDLSDALEIAAEYCAERGWNGIVTPHTDPDPVGDGSDPFDCDDMTYTESGWITSYEWGVYAEDPTPERIAAIHHGRTN